MKKKIIIPFFIWYLPTYLIEVKKKLFLTESPRVPAVGIDSDGLNNGLKGDRPLGRFMILGPKQIYSRAVFRLVCM